MKPDRRFGFVDYGRAYDETKIDELEAKVANWLQSGPGVFRSENSAEPYTQAQQAFYQFSEHSTSIDDFEIALSRLGYRAGLILYGGKQLWILILPSKPVVQASRIVTGGLG